ncbi:helix-turn-helix domain-containing protein [Lysobacter panacisoli]|uniref:Resolvase HTH domain-containing protein n=1 Tax=Lysobacter panacisoli TaxID=1255263 RepID=A0ABP9LDI8_9GAMM|nr:helix-turn-helix domain-containing protein [Lysobacter panacisoli]
MSRAILKIALSSALGREPTYVEFSAYLQALRNHGGDRVYIPQRETPDADQAAKILELRRGGMSIRKIAREVRTSKSQVHRALSQNPDLFVDKEAA